MADINPDVSEAIENIIKTLETTEDPPRDTDGDASAQATHVDDPSVLTEGSPIFHSLNAHFLFGRQGTHF
jgi:hypothetical protein